MIKTGNLPAQTSTQYYLRKRSPGRLVLRSETESTPTSKRIVSERTSFKSLISQNSEKDGEKQTTTDHPEGNCECCFDTSPSALKQKAFWNFINGDGS